MLTVPVEDNGDEDIYSRLTDIINFIGKTQSRIKAFVEEAVVEEANEGLKSVQLCLLRILEFLLLLRYFKSSQIIF